MTIRLREGFVGQDMYVIPRPILAEARRHPLVRNVYPTDIGWYPNARFHWRQRLNGSPEDHLMLCVDGHGFLEIEGKKAHLQQGQAIIIPRNREHVYWAEEDNPWSTYWMHFLGVNADYYIDEIPEVGQPFSVEHKTGEETIRLFRDCLDAIEGGYTLRNLIYAAQTAQHILSLLLFRNSALPIGTKNEKQTQTCDVVIEFMRENLANPVRLEDFAVKAGMSVSHFSEVFRKQTHQSPMSFFTNLRIRAACRLLDFSEKPIKAVSIETGYMDPYYFSRVFKKVMGVSPEKYRGIMKS